MAQKLLIRDLTLRDGQQSSFATRMTQAQIDRVLPLYKKAGFYAMEVWGGAVPDSVMRYLSENPWTRLEKIKAEVGDVSKLTALSRGRNLFGYAPYTDEIIEGFCRNSIESGLGIMRIFDALNDVNNVKSTVKYIKKYGGIADCAVCYTIDPKFTRGERIKARLKGHPLPKAVFTNEYFVNKAKELADLGADMISIKDMSGLIPPSVMSELIPLFKDALKVPIDFHTHCTPGYGLGAALTAIIHGVDILDTNIWNFAGGTGAPAIELIYIFCQKLGVELDIDMSAVARIDAELYNIRHELAAVDASKQFPRAFNPLIDKLPAEVDALFDKAIAEAKANNEEELLKACHAIEAYFQFPKPNELVKKAEVPGGMYSNMVAQLKALNSMDILENAMHLIPTVRLAAGLPPLVTPTSQIVGAQAVNCAMDVKSGKPMYSNVSNQFFNLVKGEYGKTPVPVDPKFREKITGSPIESDYDTSNYKMQPNPTLPEAGGVKLAENEKEQLLLELFPQVAKNFLTKVKVEAYQKVLDAEVAKKAEEARKRAEEAAAKKAAIAERFKSLKGKGVVIPIPGTVLEISVKVGDKVKRGDQLLVLEAMKMENSITSDYDGIVGQIFCSVGEAVPAEAPLFDIVKPEVLNEETAAPAKPEPAKTEASKPNASDAKPEASEAKPEEQTKAGTFTKTIKKIIENIEKHTITE